jgi:hypothetical protein
MHKPEFWGYVQFSHMPPGTDEYRADPLWGERMALMEVYNAQKRHKDENGVWDANPTLPNGVSLAVTDEGWEAKGRALRVRHDSLIRAI